MEIIQESNYSAMISSNSVPKESILLLSVFYQYYTDKRGYFDRKFGHINIYIN